MKKLLALTIASIISSPFAIAHQAGDILVRGGAAAVIPKNGGDNVLGTGELDVDNDIQLGLTFSYMITDNWGVELLAATPFSHRVTTAGLGEVATLKHLPPTLMAQYYFGQANSKLRPYVGVGVNYTTFFNEKGKGALANTEVKVDDSWGIAGQIGIDADLEDNWFANASFWMIDIDADVHTAVGTIETHVDPMVFMVGIGYRF